MKRWLNRWFSGRYLDVLHLIATHYREKRIRAGCCYAPGCSQYGIVWLDQAGIFCWDHYCEEMRRRRSEHIHEGRQDEA